MIRHYDMASGHIVDQPGAGRDTRPALPGTEERLVTPHEIIAPGTVGSARMPADLVQTDIEDFISRQR
jgi:hypothetical protein